MYLFLDYFLAFTHTGLILFNLTGWAWVKTMRLHLLTMTLAMLSWFIAGVFYGWGYCPLTDLHWEIKRTLGETNIPISYVKYYLDKLFAYSFDPILLSNIVVPLGILVFILSIWVNLKNRTPKNL